MDEVENSLANDALKFNSTCICFHLSTILTELSPRTSLRIGIGI